MAHYIPTGPAHLYVRSNPGTNPVPVGNPGTSSGYLYLGTCERAPKIAIKPAYEPVMNAVGGTQIASDKAYQGEEALIVCPVNRLNESVYAMIAARPRHNLNGVPRGTNTSIDIGAMLIQNSLYLELVMSFQFGGTINAVPNLPAGYTFYAAEAEQDDIDDLGTTAKKDTLVFTANRIYIPLNAGVANAGGWGLYTATIPAGLPTPD